MKFIITESEKNKILELYGLSNQSINEGLSDKTEFSATSSGSSWIITYKAADEQFYPFSDLPESRNYPEYKESYNSERRAKKAIEELIKKLKGSNNEKPTNDSKYSNITTDVPSGKESKYTTNIPTGYPSGKESKYTTNIPTGYASGVV